MTDEQKPPQPAPQQPETSAPPPPVPQQPSSAPTDVNEGKSFAILSYALNFVGIPFFLVPLLMRNNEFALFHAKQCLIIWLGGVVASAVGVPLSLICIGVIVLIVAGIFLLVVNILGLINAIKGEQKPIPLIGQWGVDWFKGIKKA